MPKELANKPKQTRKRIPRTCAQCRKRKQKCDSLKPCAVCKLRGEGDLCDYAGAQPTRVLDEEDELSTPVSAEELKILKQQLEHLEHAVVAVLNRSSIGPSPSINTDPDNPWEVDLEEFNFAGTLSNIMLSKIATPEMAQEPPIIEMVRRQCRFGHQLPPPPPSSLCTTTGLSTYFYDVFNFNQHTELQNRLPTFEQSHAFLSVYLQEFQWFHSCFNPEAYTVFLPRLYGLIDTKEDIPKQLVSMATCFAIARMAIVKLSVQQASELKLPTNKLDRLEQSKHWLDLSVACLKCADFEVNPRLESISCLIILLEAAWFDETIGGLEDLSTLFDLKCKAIHLAFDLCLHRDPSRRDPTGTLHIDPILARERRIIWWALLSIDGLYSGLVGRMSSIVALESVDVFLPALSGTVNPEHVHEGCEKGCQTLTPVASVKPRLLISYVAHEISRLPLQRNPFPTINDVHQAHRDLVSLETHLSDACKLYSNGHTVDRNRIPHCSRARRDAFHFYMRYHYLFVKLHRSLHIVKRAEYEKAGIGSKNSYHRAAVVDHALLLLDLRRVSRFGPDYIYGNVLVLEASFSLALDYLYDSTSDVANLIKEELLQYCSFLQNSKVWLIKRGQKMLECLMASWSAPLPVGISSWFSTHEGPISPISPTTWAQGPFHQSPETDFTVAAPKEQVPNINQLSGPADLPPYSALRPFQVLHPPGPSDQHTISQPQWSIPTLPSSLDSHQPQSAQAASLMNHYVASHAMPEYGNSPGSQARTAVSQLPLVAPPGFNREIMLTGQHHHPPFNQFQQHNNSNNGYGTSQNLIHGNEPGDGLSSQANLNIEDLFSASKPNGGCQGLIEHAHPHIHHSLNSSGNLNSIAHAPHHHTHSSQNHRPSHQEW
ncbi:hypothetical protein O181_067597 [Austropuccinia psidii MF-1]|uniref:Zn(2)-C6 fungal-type domain-containing protein n=1 Tax=Austropuccinia psidii MF-1 TaxID=1389203 RepID=A0A9Q3F111_9BASI|nr:hypothetical protein [Austropuccinia psidii MF-1]